MIEWLLCRLGRHAYTLRWRIESRHRHHVYYECTRCGKRA